MKKKIRLAVIGSTSSGKTYLLRDMIESFSRLGYDRCEEALGNLYKTPADYRQELDDQDGIRQNAVVHCRIYNEYRGVLVNRDRRRFDLGFLDIPGEIFEGGRIQRFIRIIHELSRLGKCFVYDVYKHDNVSSKVLRFVGRDGKVEPSEEYNRLVEDIYVSRGYELRNILPVKIRNVSGRKIVTHFFDYDTDSVIEAITQAIPYFSPVAGISKNEFVQDLVGRDMFYFFYTLYATDVILCDKLVMPEDVSGEAPVAGSPVIQMQRLYNINEFEPCRKKYYMAFRGADALIKNCLGDLKRRDMDVNEIYALIVFLWEYKLEGRNRCPHSELEQYLGERLSMYLREKSIPKCAEKYLKDEYVLQPYYNQGADWHLCHGEDLTVALRQRIQTAIRDFMTIRADAQDAMDIFMAPHIFLTSSAIANDLFDYEVTGNSPTNIRQMDGPCAHASNRACFGTLQLSMSLLLRNNICYDANVADIALVEDYIR